MRARLLLAISILMLAACQPVSPADGGPALPPAAASPTRPPVEPSRTPAFITQTSAPTTEPPPPVDPSIPQAAFYLVALEDNGLSGTLVGCGDSLIPVLVSVPEGERPTPTALAALLDLSDPYYGESGLYNALAQSSLQVDSLDVDGGTVYLRLIGQLVLGGVCDAPRVQGQLESTLLYASGAERAEITVNGVPLADLLSGQ
ncbi:MAG TPA: hypothetical protein PLV53_05630 [Anaerolineaceae bacterium]|nr:hypothetical protein [Anaerolineaceae bacterium]